jgi:hypothetical protein
VLRGNSLLHDGRGAILLIRIFLLNWSRLLGLNLLSCHRGLSGYDGSLLSRLSSNLRGWYIIGIFFLG